MPPPMDPSQLNNYFLNGAQTTYRKNLTDSSGSITLPAGGYFATLDSTDPAGCTLRAGAAAAAPTNGASAVGSHLPTGTPFTLVLRAETALHAIMNTASATGTLWLTKVR